MSRKDSKGRVLNKGESERNDGRYSYRWKDYSGHEKYVYAKNLNELRILEKDIIYKTSLGLSLKSDMTLDSVIRKWLDIKQDISLSSKELYSLNYKSVIKGTKISQMKIGEIKKSDVLYFLKTLSDEKKYANSTIGTIFTVINQAMQLAYDDGLIARNPCQSIKITNKKSSSKKIALTPKQEEELLDRINNSPKSERIYPLVAILLNNGLRISEAIGLTWDDVDIDNGIIFINKQAIRLKNHETKQSLTISKPKTDAGIRTIYMTEYVKELFRQQQQISYKTNSNIKIDNCSNFVFTTNRGTNLSARALQYTLKYLSDDMNASRKVILPHVTPHVLRHTACTKMINSGMNIKAVQTIMGHADIGVTLETYTHINNEQLRNEIKKLEYVSE